MGPDSRHCAVIVFYSTLEYMIYIISDLLKINVVFREKSVRWSHTPPLAYAFINVDNCERSIRHYKQTVCRCVRVKSQ